MIRFGFLILLCCFIGINTVATQFVVGIENVVVPRIHFNFTPVVLPDLISAKLAVEYRMHRKLNLVVPFEAKWMDYHDAIKLGARIFNKKGDYPESWYKENRRLKPGFDVDIAHHKVSTGIGVKWFPFSESMKNAFFIKTIGMIGFERFFSYKTETVQNSAVLTHAVTFGYSWFKRSGFTMSVEAGEEFVWHTHPLPKLPHLFLSGFLPMVQFSLGFTH